jgi:hypothetical protein
MMNPLAALSALSLKGKAVAAAALAAGGYLLARGFGIVGGAPKPSAKSSSAPSSSTPLGVPLANLPSVVNPLTGQRTQPGAATLAAAAADPLAAAAVALAGFLAASGCKDPSVMRSVAQFQAMTSLKPDGQYGPVTRAELAKHLAIAPPPACTWS